MSATGTDNCLAFDVAAALVLWAPNILVFIPDLHMTVLTHLAMVSFVTALCGLM